MTKSHMLKPLNHVLEFLTLALIGHVLHEKSSFRGIITHPYISLYSLMIALYPMYFRAACFCSAFALTEYAPHCTR